MSSLVSGLFGSKAKPSQSLSGYSAAPSFTQATSQKIDTLGNQIAGTTAPYAPVDYLPQQLTAINSLMAGIPQYKGSGFKFGQQANNAFGNANNMYSQAGNYLAGSMPYIQQSADYTASGVNPITGQEIQSSINDFMNPYTDSVINNTVRDISQYGNSLFSDARGLVSDAGGSGSNRANLLAGDIALKQMQAVGDASSQLRNQGYQAASTNALNRLQQDRANYLAGAGLSLNQASGMQNAASGANSIGNSYAGLGNNYLSAKQLFNNIGQQNYLNQVDAAKNSIAAGNYLRSNQQQENQIPLQQLQTLLNITAPFLGASSSNGGRAATSGLLGSGGNYLQGLFGLSTLANNGETDLGNSMPWLGGFV